MDNCYAFLYSKEEEGKKKCILMKCVVIDDFLAIDALDLEAHHKESCHVQINVKDFFSEDQPNTYKDMYKNFTGFVYILNSSLLVELDGKDAVAAQNPDAERSWSINSFENILWENLSIRTSEPASFGNVMWENLSTRSIEPVGSPSSSESVMWENMSIRTIEPVCSGNILLENLSTRTIEPVSSENVLWKNLSIRTIEPTCSGNVMRKNLSTRTTEPASSGNILLENLSRRTIEPVGSPSSPENILWKNMSIRTTESTSSENVLWENISIRSTEPTSLTYPPGVLVGHDDTFPDPGAGFYPHSGGTGGSMHIGPNYPCFFPSNISTPFGDPGSVPPGGRYDPIGPPDVPGFEPSRSVRRSRHSRHSGGNTHPNLEFFLQGPDFF